ncbi:threonine/serine dehydratase [Roseomonas sp. JC162]|uniref:Threonine/serine dehydratase n=2 Tax=Neoroseomonas marina TaxID=1232220 RepID=A0A848ECF4_9PROT|nr:threonine/serine dehydratase [Neoroseomonas marina]
MVTQDDIRAAAARIAPHIRRTPVIRLSAEDTGLGFPLTLKLEQLQVTGSFKPRGAFNRMLSASVPPAGVIAASGGNHGIAVAHAARILGVKAEIFVPEITSEAKRARIAETGATLMVGGAAYDQARRASEARAAETGALIVHAYDQAEVLAGQGTVGLEFEEDAPDLTHLVVAAGGGGLYGGIASWYQERVDMIVAEPDECPTLLAAGLAGQPVDVPSGGIAADSLGARRVGALPFEVLSSVGGRLVVVKDDMIRTAQRWLWDRLRVVAEPGGATAFAVVLGGGWTPPEAAEVGVLVCGANCDPASILG